MTADRREAILSLVQILRVPLNRNISAMIVEYSDEVLVFVSGLDMGSQTFYWRCMEHSGPEGFGAETMSLVSARIARRLVEFGREPEQQRKWMRQDCACKL